MPPKAATQVPIPVDTGDGTRSLPFAYTSFFAPPPVNAKNVASQYLRADSQTWSGRNAAAQMATNGTAALAAKGKKRRRNGRPADTGDATPASEGVYASDEEQNDLQNTSDAPSTASNTIVIHAGSRHLRIGLSSDLAPITVPHILARRDQLTAQRRKEEDAKGRTEEEEEERQAVLTRGIEELRNDLKSIMRNMKLRPVASGRQQTANYNAGIKPEKVPEHQDMFATDWTESKKVKEDVMLGEKALRLDSFSKSESAGVDRPWTLFQPFKGGHLNFHDYTEHYGPSASRSALLSDVQTIWSHALTAPKDVEKESASQVIDQGLGIPASDWMYYNVLLVIPDLYLLAEVECLVGLLLHDMGFAAAMVQQESVCATYGAGLSAACVIHIGSEQSHVTCVDDGFVVADSRITLGYGGERISAFFMQLLQRANFPYHDINQSRRLADRWLANELKERLCTMDPTQLGMTINEFYVRLPSKETRKYSLRTYDEIIIGPMCLFNPRVLPFPATKNRLLPSLAASTALTEEDLAEADAGALPATMAMTGCVRHLLPAPPPAPVVPVAAVTAAVAPTDPAESSKQGTPALETTNVTNGKTRVEELANGQAKASGTQSPSAPTDDGQTPTPSRRTSPVPIKAKPANDGSTADDDDAMDVDAAPSGPSVDVVFEASKVALDWAVWNSVLSSLASAPNPVAMEDRMKRLATNMFCTGGTALMPGVGMAVEARVHSYFSQWFTQQGKDQATLPNATVVPPPRDMDPRIVTWKGLAVLARLDGAQDMWVLREEWTAFGMRALREKAYFL